MKTISLFLCLLGFSNFLYPASVADAISLNDSEGKKISKELTAVSRDCSRFHLDHTVLSKSELMEAAESLVNKALLLHKKSLVGLILVGKPFLENGVGLGNVETVLPNLQAAQTNEKLTRCAILYSCQRLIDAINKESHVYAAPPSEKDVQNHIVQLKKRRTSVISSSYIEKVLNVESYLGLDKKIFREDLLGDSTDSDLLISSNTSSSCCQIQ